jgi:hypothetical protein
MRYPGDVVVGSLAGSGAAAMDSAFVDRLRRRGEPRPAITRRCSSTQDTSGPARRPKKVAMDSRSSSGGYREKVE